MLYAGGAFTGAGGNLGADHIAVWDGSSWSAIGSPPLNGPVNAIAYHDGKIYAGGSFTNAGGNADADFLQSGTGRAGRPATRRGRRSTGTSTHSRSSDRRSTWAANS